MARETLHFTLLPSLLLLVFAGVLEAQQVGTAKTQSGSFQVEFSKGHLSVRANEAPIGKILEDIGIAVSGWKKKSRSSLIRLHLKMGSSNWPKT